MNYLILTVLLNALISVILKYFDRFRIHSLQAIVVNYWVCVITGSLALGFCPIGRASVSQPWTPWALLLGAGFISIFNLFAYCTRKDGITPATIANKLSLIIPVLCSVYLYSEHLSWVHISGIVLAFPAIYLASVSKSDTTQTKSSSLFWPALLFLGSGILDTLVKYAENTYLDAPQLQAVFTTHIFAVAGIIGTLLCTVLLLTRKIRFAWRNVAAGLILGVPNYFSIYYFIRMLHSDFLPSAASIPLNNVCILIVSSVAALLLFRERLTARKLAGIALAIVAIVLLGYSRG
jgi:drug/metabolite transporter (DMT)-like permease